MILIDRGNKPENTVLYIASQIYVALSLKNGGADYTELYKTIKGHQNDFNDAAFSLALNFLYLLEKISIDERGLLYAISNDSIDK